MSAASGTENMFCATGKGGGVDPSCGKDDDSISVADDKLSVDDDRMHYDDDDSGHIYDEDSPGPYAKGYVGDGSKDDPVQCRSNLKLALKALGDGKHISLNQPEQVSTLMDKMHKYVKGLKKQGKEAPNFDLCKVSVPNTNLFCQESLGVPRIKMPQLGGTPAKGSEGDKLPKNEKGEVDLSEKFIEHLKSQGISTKETTINASHLRASQNELIGAKVAHMLHQAEKGERDLTQGRIFVTRDNYVLDGHHRWAAAIGLHYKEGKELMMPVHKLDMDIGQAISEANTYTEKMGIPHMGTKPTKNSAGTDFTVNVTIAGVKRVLWGGVEWFVANIVSIVPGVLNGSQGSLRYTPAEIAAKTKHWDDIPITVYHPFADGKHVSANYRGVWNRQGVGWLRRSVFNGRLSHKGWFNAKKTHQVDKRVYQALADCADNGYCKPMEVSTGLFTDNIPLVGTYNGKSHEWDATNHQPDHLAVLPDQIGACSVADGCGLMVNVNGSPKDGCSKPDS